MGINKTVSKARLDAALANGTIKENDITFVKDTENYEGIVVGNSDNPLKFPTVPSSSEDDAGKILSVNNNGIPKWIQVDNELSNDSTNPVQNKVVKEAFDEWDSAMERFNENVGNLNDIIQDIDEKFDRVGENLDNINRNLDYAIEKIDQSHDISIINVDTNVNTNDASTVATIENLSVLFEGFPRHLIYYLPPIEEDEDDISHDYIFTLPNIPLTQQYINKVGYINLEVSTFGDRNIEYGLHRIIIKYGNTEKYIVNKVGANMNFGCRLRVLVTSSNVLLSVDNIFNAYIAFNNDFPIEVEPQIETMEEGIEIQEEPQEDAQIEGELQEEAAQTE